MPSFQVVEIMGHIGRDPETRFTQSGIAKTSFSVAVSDRWKKDGEVHEETEWFNVVAWRKEWLDGRILKGDLVLVRGKLKTREYEKDGQKRRVTDLVADTVMPINGKKAAGAGDEVPDGSGDPDVPF